MLIKKFERRNNNEKIISLTYYIIFNNSPAKDTIELNQTTVKGSKTSDYTAPPKEQKNTFVITQERIREKNYKNRDNFFMDLNHVSYDNRNLDSADRSSIIKAKRTLKISELSLFC